MRGIAGPFNLAGSDWVKSFWQVAVVDHVEHHAAWAAQGKASHCGLADCAFIDVAQVRQLPPVQAGVLADLFDLCGGHAGNSSTKYERCKFNLPPAPVVRLMPSPMLPCLLILKPENMSGFSALRWSIKKRQLPLSLSVTIQGNLAQGLFTQSIGSPPHE